MCMFSSDFPHIEGGRNPMKRFDASLEGFSQEAKDGFYCNNFVDFMGEGLAEELRYPAVVSKAMRA